jgi:hypothetical protein
MVSVLFLEKFNKYRGNNIFKSVYSDFFINLFEKFYFNIKVFSTPKVLFKP